MKKIILAPAVALAFTGLVASPVAAAESTSAQSSSTQKAEQKKTEAEKAEAKKKEEAKKAAAEKAEAEKKAAAEKAAAEKKAKEKAEAAKKAAEKKADEKKKAAEDKADEKKKAAEDKADKKDDAEKPPKKVDPKPAPAPKDEDKDAKDDDKSEDKANPINASVQVTSGEVTAEELAEEGVTVKVTGLEKGDKVSAKSGLTGPAVTAQGSTATMKLHSAKEVTQESVSFAVQVQREDADAKTLTGAAEVDVQAAIDASLSVSPEEITPEDLADKNKGVDVTVTGLEEGDDVTNNLTNDTETADASGSLTLHLWYEGDPAELEVGKLPFTVTIDREGEESETLDGEINIVDDDAVDPIDASLKVDPKEITAEDLANKDKGVTVTVSGVKKGDKIKDSLTGETETADADGDYKLHLWHEGNPDNLEVGKVPFTVTIDREGTESETLEGNINVVAEDGDDDGDDGSEDGNDDGKDGSDDGDDGETEAPADASFTVSPKKIEAADFANENKGVTLAVENCEPGADVHFEVNPKGINVTAYENTVTADDEGNASVNVFGTSSDVSAYVGAYTATATCGDDTMKDSFTVTGGANGGGSDGGDNGNAGNGGDDGSQLPRTGADLGGLTTGALLLLVGGAAIALTGRKNKFGQTPTSF
jgi:chemotaxis protein histidine kinase CheA